MAVRNRPFQVALLIETSRGFGRGVIEGIVQYVREHGPWSVQFEERGLEDRPPQWLQGWRGDGIIARTATSELARAIRNTGVPTVELLTTGRANADVECDHNAVGRLATEHFLDRGLRQFGFFAFGEAAWIRMRRDGFIRAVTSHGYQCLQYRPSNPRQVALPHWCQKQHVLVAQWLRSLPQPLGIFCASDVYAMWLLESCRGCKIAVPEQIAVLGVDNDSVICGVTNPSLSSVDLDSRRIGYEATALLHRRMTRRTLHAKPIWLPPSHIVARQSTDILAVNDVDVALAIRFIRENALRGIQVPSVAEAVGLSRRALERRFQRCLGRSPKAEILRMQIENAKILLIRSELSIEAIVQRCGFSSFKYFGQVFRREVGVTPSSFRKTRHTSEK
jgi:LacI family transcriptional regulator